MFFTPVNTPAEQSYKTGRCDTVQWKAEKSKVMTSADFHYTLVKDKITYNKNILSIVNSRKFILLIYLSTAFMCEPQKNCRAAGLFLTFNSLI